MVCTPNDMSASGVSVAAAVLVAGAVVEVEVTAAAVTLGIATTAASDVAGDAVPVEPHAPASSSIPKAGTTRRSARNCRRGLPARGSGLSGSAAAIYAERTALEFASAGWRRPCGRSTLPLTLR